MTVTEIAGFAGAGLAGAAYVPQIRHLVKAHCSAGISPPAFGVWLLAALLTTAQAIAIHAGVFIVLGGIEIVATALVMFYAARYKDTACLSHLPGQPSANAVTGTRTPASGPGARGPAGRSAAETATSAEHGRARPVLPARQPHAHAATEFQVTHLKGAT